MVRVSSKAKVGKISARGKVLGKTIRRSARDKNVGKPLSRKVSKSERVQYDKYYDKYGKYLEDIEKATEGQLNTLAMSITPGGLVTEDPKEVKEKIRDYTLEKEGFKERKELGGKITNKPPKLVEGKWVMSEDYSEYDPNTGEITKYKVSPTEYREQWRGTWRDPEWSSSWEFPNLPVISREEYERESRKGMRGRQSWTGGSEKVPTKYQATAEAKFSPEKFQTYQYLLSDPFEYQRAVNRTVKKDVLKDYYESQYKNNSKYVIDKDSSGNIKKIYTKPEEVATYKDYSSGFRSTKDVIFHEIDFKNGVPTKEIRRGTYREASDKGSKTTGIYNIAEINYDSLGYPVKEIKKKRLYKGRREEPVVEYITEFKDWEPTVQEQYNYYNDDLIGKSRVNYLTGNVKTEDYGYHPKDYSNKAHLLGVAKQNYNKKFGTNLSSDQVQSALMLEAYGSTLPEGYSGTKGDFDKFMAKNLGMTYSEYDKALKSGKIKDPLSTMVGRKDYEASKNLNIPLREYANLPENLKFWARGASSQEIKDWQLSEKEREKKYGQTEKILTNIKGLKGTLKVPQWSQRQKELARKGGYVKGLTPPKTKESIDAGTLFDVSKLSYKTQPVGYIRAEGTKVKSFGLPTISLESVGLTGKEAARSLLPPDVPVRRSGTVKERTRVVLPGYPATQITQLKQQQTKQKQQRPTMITRYFKKSQNKEKQNVPNYIVRPNLKLTGTKLLPTSENPLGNLGKREKSGSIYNKIFGQIKGKI